MSLLTIPDRLLADLKDRPDMLAMLIDPVVPSTTYPAMWLLLAKCFIPAINRNTIPHLAWRYNMLAWSDHITHGLPRPEKLLDTTFFEQFTGVQATGIPFKSHADFIRTSLSPHLHNLSAGQVFAS